MASDPRPPRVDRGEGAAVAPSRPRGDDAPPDESTRPTSPPAPSDPQDRGRPLSLAATKPGLDVADLYRRYGPLVLRRGRRFLGDAEAEEVLHEVFLKALERGHEFRGESSPATWLFRVTTHLCLNRRRDSKRRAELLARHGPTVWDRSDAGEAPEARAFLQTLWATLPEELAMIGILYWVDGLTTAEIGRMLGVSDRTIANRLTTLTAAARRAGGEP